MKLICYGIKNIAMAVIVAAIGTASVSSNGLNSVISTLVGICLILCGLNSFQKTSLWVSVLFVALGIGAISVGETVLKDNEVSYYVSSALLAVIGVLQLKKIFDSYGRKTWQRVLTKVLSIVYPLSILAGVVFSVFLQNRSLGTAFYGIGALCWIIHTVLVIKFEKHKKESGGKSNTNSGYSGCSGSASQSKVADKMKSLANYLTGGFDSLGYGVSVKYIVDVRVSSGKISFNVSGKLSGGDELKYDAQVNSVKDSLEKAFERRSQLIINEAKKELEKIEPDCDYSIEVTGGDVS